MSLTHKGILIAIEGIDGSGKSTLTQQLAIVLDHDQYEVYLTKEPGDTSLGHNIRSLVQTQMVPITPIAEYLLFAADRAQHFVEKIIPLLNANKIIISDRLSDSSLAYQGYGRGLPLEQLKAINSWAMQGIIPDITIFVRIPVAIALQRVTKRNTSLSAFEKEVFLEKVAAGFELIYKNRSDVIIIDGTQPLAIMVNNAYDALQKRIHYLKKTGV